MSALIDTAGSLVAKMKTQAFAEGHELTQSTDDRRAAYARIDQALERFMAHVREFAPLLEAVDSYREVRREIERGERAGEADRLEQAVRRMLNEIESLSRPTSAPTPVGVPGFVRAGDVQIPIAPEPAT